MAQMQRHQKRKRLGLPSYYIVSCCIVSQLLPCPIPEAGATSCSFCVPTGGGAVFASDRHHQQHGEQPFGTQHVHQCQQPEQQRQ